jgi:hypothetical protein
VTLLRLVASAEDVSSQLPTHSNQVAAQHALEPSARN